MLFKFKAGVGGTHAEPLPNGRRALYGRNDIILSNRPLNKVFANKFEEVEDTPENRARVPSRVLEVGKTAKAAQAAAEAVKPQESEADHLPAGEEMKDSRYVGKNVRVFRDKKKYNVYDADDLVSEPLNEEPLTSKKAVAEFLKEV